MQRWHNLWSWLSEWFSAYVCMSDDFRDVEAITRRTRVKDDHEKSSLEQRVYRRSWSVEPSRCADLIVVVTNLRSLKLRVVTYISASREMHVETWKWCFALSPECVVNWTNDLKNREKLWQLHKMMVFSICSNAGSCSSQYNNLRHHIWPARVMCAHQFKVARMTNVRDCRYQLYVCVCCARKMI